MKHDLIPKHILDDALFEIFDAAANICTDNKEVAEKLLHAYETIQKGRTQCNIQPEQP